MNPDRLLTASLRAHPRGLALAEIMAAALDAVDPALAVQRALHRDGDAVIVGDTRYEHVERIIVVGAGKAGAPMAQAAQAALGERLSAGLVVVKEGHLGDDQRPTTNDERPLTNDDRSLLVSGRSSLVPILEAGHPVPDERGVAAAQQIVKLVQGLNERDLVLVLISGGGSALLTLPVAELTLADLQALTTALLRCGATIGEINTLRKHCTQLFGGQLAQLAAPARIASLIVSDVVGSPLDVIASGPTTPDPTTFADAWRLIQHYQLESALPPALIDRFQRGLRHEIAETPKPDDPRWANVQNTIIASNAIAAEAARTAAQQRGFSAAVLTTYLEGEAREIGRVAAAIARERTLRGQADQPTLLIAGGETTVTIRGNGLGGRNQELALGAVAGLDGLDGACVIALATDGGDGPTDAAGAVVTGATLQRAREQNLDPVDVLQRNDAYHFFAALDDLLRPGPTLTNVNDLLFVVTGG